VGEIAMPVEDLGTWPVIAEIEVREEGWQKIGEWSMGEGELRRL